MSITVGSDRRTSTEEPHQGTAPTGNARRVRLGFGGLVLAVGLLALGTMMRSNASFAEDYVARQLGQQRITFKPADTLTPDERGTPCLVAYAGTPLTSGPQAECYANEFIGHHLPMVADGKTFSEMREVQTALRAQIAEAQAKSDPAIGDLQRQLAEVTGKRQSLFEGETMRGLLLTTYGFSTLGDKAGQAATASYAGGGALLLLSLAVLARATARRPAR